MSGLIERIDLNLAGESFTDELHTDLGALAFQLDHDWFWGGADLAIRTASGGGGTLLVEGIDYQLSVEDADLGSRSGKTVYRKVQIITVGYQTGALYFSGKYIADSNEADDINFALGIALVDTFAKWQRNLVHSMFVTEVRAWDKSLCARAFCAQIDTGTADGDTTDHLVDSGANFAGVTVGDVVYNSTDGVYATITVINGPTDLTLDWDAFPNGNEDYEIYDEPELPEKIVECNGQTISDAESALDGITLEDLNGEERFLRGRETSGRIEADAFQGHWHEDLQNDSPGVSNAILMYRNSSNEVIREDRILDPVTDGVNGVPRTAADTRPKNMSVVWITRIK